MKLNWKLFFVAHQKGKCPNGLPGFEQEDLSNTFTNQLFAIGHYYKKEAQTAKEREIYEKNLKEPAFSHFKGIIAKYCKDNVYPKKVVNTLLKNEFSPKEESSIAESYELATSSYKRRKRRYFDDFLQIWKKRQLELMFKNLPWRAEQRVATLAEFFPEKPITIKEPKKCAGKQVMPLTDKRMPLLSNILSISFSKIPRVTKWKEK